MTRFTDPDRLTVKTADGWVKVPRSIYELCRFLSDRPGFVRSRVEIMDALSIEWDVNDRSIDSLVKRARKLKIEGIETRAGFGYCWAE